MATYAIGDVHGALTRLNRLLAYLDDADHLVFLGDYIDKGPNSKGVIEAVRALAHDRPCTFLMGNHEFVWLRHVDGEDRSDFLTQLGAKEALASYLGHPVDAAELNALLNDRQTLRGLLHEDLEFMRGLERYCAPSGTRAVCVHGGIAPDFGDKDLDGHDLEQLLFLRFGRSASDTPWRGRIVVCGHTVVGRNPVAGKGSIAIDTGAWMNDGRLTALELSNFRFVQDDGTTGALSMPHDAAV